MFQNGVQFQGDSFPGTKISVRNKTGAALVKGGIYALDLTKVSGGTVSHGDQLGNLVIVVAANKAGILVVAEKALADGDQGLATIQGPVSVMVDGNVAAIAAGDPLVLVVPAGTNPAYLKKGAQAIGNADLILARSLDANTTAFGATNQATVFFSGLGVGYINNPAVS